MEIETLQKRLEEAQQRWQELKKVWNSHGSRYGDEYIEIQMKVYEARINKIKSQILETKKGQIKKAAS